MKQLGSKVCATPRRHFLRQVGALGTSAFLDRSVHAADTIPTGVTRLADQFVREALPEGGVDVAKSIWQKPGRGTAVGGNSFTGGIDPR